MSDNKTISMDDYAKKLWNRNKRQIEVVYGGASQFFKEKLKEEVEEGIAKRRKRQLERKREEIEHELSQLEEEFSLESYKVEIDHEETEEHWESALETIFERDNDPREQFEDFIDGQYSKFRNNYQKVPFEQYKEFLFDKAEEKGYDTSKIREVDGTP